MATRLPNYQMTDGRTRLGQSYFNPIWADLDSRLDTLERIKLDWNAQVAQLRDLGLRRIDEYIRPVVDEVNDILQQAQDDTDGIAQHLVDQHITPLVNRVNGILQQAQDDTDGIAQTLVDDHFAPLLAQAQQLISDIQGIKQAGQQSADDLAAALANFSTTASRNDPSAEKLLQAKAMDDHRQSGDHDDRYYTKTQTDDRHHTKAQADARYYKKAEVDQIVGGIEIDSVWRSEPISPAGGEVPPGISVTLVGGGYYPLYGHSQAQREFHIIEQGGSWFEPAYSGVEIPQEDSAETSHAVAAPLTEGAVYQWRYRDTTASGDTGPWSLAAEFIAPPDISSYQPGDPLAGGYFAGVVTSDHDGSDYALIVSDGGGDSEKVVAGNMKWRSTRTEVSSTDGVPPRTDNDGRANHKAVLALNDLADFPAFKWVEDNCNAGAGLNGQKGWYLPSKGELGIIFDSFAPGAASTPDSFKTGGADAFATGYYWSSTEYSSDNAWFQRFSYGFQNYNDKDNSGHVRAVRRIKL